MKVLNQEHRMAQRPQPSLRFADGGNFVTRWAQSVCFQDGGHVLGTVEPEQSLG